MSDKAKKIDTELLEQMKAMEAAKREESLKGSDVTIITGSNDEKVDFDTWWMDINRRVKMKPWMKEIVQADFKGRGLGRRESMKKFDESLRLFGIKF